MNHALFQFKSQTDGVSRFEFIHTGDHSVAQIEIPSIATLIRRASYPASAFPEAGSPDPLDNYPYISRPAND